jgi:hypothetical protein
LGTRRIEIGTNERHLLEVKWSTWTGVVSVVLDGKEVWSKFYGDLIPLLFETEIGTSERHRVRLVVTVGSFDPSLKLYVDGLEQEIV